MIFFSVSWVGLSVSSIQVSIVCASTELKTRLVTLTCDFCISESFVAATNLCALEYIIFFSDFNFGISFSVLNKCQSLKVDVRPTTITTQIVVAIAAFMIFPISLKSVQFPFALAFTMSDFFIPKTWYWIRDIWTYFDIVKAHANGSANSWKIKCEVKSV